MVTVASLSTTVTDEYRSSALPSSAKVPLPSAVTVSVGGSLMLVMVIVKVYR